MIQCDSYREHCPSPLSIFPPSLPELRLPPPLCLWKSRVIIINLKRYRAVWALGEPRYLWQSGPRCWGPVTQAGKRCAFKELHWKDFWKELWTEGGWIPEWVRGGETPQAGRSSEPGAPMSLKKQRERLVLLEPGKGRSPKREAPTRSAGQDALQLFSRGGGGEWIPRAPSPALGLLPLRAPPIDWTHVTSRSTDGAENDWSGDRSGEWIRGGAKGNQHTSHQGLPLSLMQPRVLHGPGKAARGKAGAWFRMETLVLQCGDCNYFFLFLPGLLLLIKQAAMWKDFYCLWLSTHLTLTVTWQATVCSQTAAWEHEHLDWWPPQPRQLNQDRHENLQRNWHYEICHPAIVSSGDGYSVHFVLQTSILHVGT